MRRWLLDEQVFPVCSMAQRRDLSQVVFEAAAFAVATLAEEALVVDTLGGERQRAALGFYTAAAELGGVIGPLLGG